MTDTQHTLPTHCANGHTLRARIVCPNCGDTEWLLTAGAPEPGCKDCGSDTAFVIECKKCGWETGFLWDAEEE